jgi:hypothetical protein
LVIPFKKANKDVRIILKPILQKRILPEFFRLRIGSARRLLQTGTEVWYEGCCKQVLKYGIKFVANRY